MMEQRDLTMLWIEQQVTEYREWLKDIFRWECAVFTVESLDGFMAWLKDEQGGTTVEINEKGE